MVDIELFVHRGGRNAGRHGSTTDTGFCCCWFGCAVRRGTCLRTIKKTFWQRGVLHMDAAMDSGQPDELSNHTGQSGATDTIAIAAGKSKMAGFHPNTV